MANSKPGKREITVTITKKLAKLLTDPDVAKRLYDVVRDTSFIVLRSYMEEAPVDRGDLRGFASVFYMQNGYRVTTTAQQNGYRYPIVVAEGSGKYKGSNIDVKYSHRQRTGRSYTDEERAMFASMRKRGIEMDIKPNKYPDRAREKSRPLVMEEFVKRLDDLL